MAITLEILRAAIIKEDICPVEEFDDLIADIRTQAHEGGIDAAHAGF
jgi:hypothetical protein